MLLYVCELENYRMPMGREHEIESIQLIYRVSLHVIRLRVYASRVANIPNIRT